MKMIRALSLCDKALFFEIISLFQRGIHRLHKKLM